MCQDELNKLGLCWTCRILVTASLCSERDADGMHKYRYHVRHTVVLLVHHIQATISKAHAREKSCKMVCTAPSKGGPLLKESCASLYQLPT